MENSQKGKTIKWDYINPSTISSVEQKKIETVKDYSLYKLMSEYKLKHEQMEKELNEIKAQRNNPTLAPVLTSTAVPTSTSAKLMPQYTQPQSQPQPQPQPQSQATPSQQSQPAFTSSFLNNLTQERGGQVKQSNQDPIIQAVNYTSNPRMLSLGNQLQPQVKHADNLNTTPLLSSLSTNNNNLAGNNFNNFNNPNTHEILAALLNNYNSGNLTSTSTSASTLTPPKKKKKSKLKSKSKPKPKVGSKPRPKFKDDDDSDDEDEDINNPKIDPKKLKKIIKILDKQDWPAIMQKLLSYCDDNVS